MRTLLFGVILALLTPGYSLPVNAAAEEDVMREAVTDGFIVGYAFPHAVTSKSPRSSGSNATASAQLPDDRQTPTDEAEEEEEEGSVPTSSDESDPTEGSGMFEGSAAADLSTTTPWEVTTSSQAPTLTSTLHSTAEAHSTLLSSDSSTTTQGYSTSSESGPISTTTVYSTSSESGPISTTTVSVTSTPSLIYVHHHTVTEEHKVTDSTTSSTALHTSTSMSTSTVAAAVSNNIVPRMISNESDPGPEEEVQETEILVNELPGLNVENPEAVADPDDTKISSKQENRRSSSWMIITAFVVGVVAMVVVLVAIATRDRWRGPPKQVASTEESKANGSNQQRELEMETFLEKGTPKEDQHTGEYTVIALNELPEKQPLQ